MDNTLMRRWRNALIAVWVGQLLYTISPFDVVPDFLPVIGWLDDAIGWLVVVMVTSWLIHHAFRHGPSVIAESREVLRDLETRGERVREEPQPPVYEPWTPEEIRGL